MADLSVGARRGALRLPLDVPGDKPHPAKHSLGWSGMNDNGVAGSVVKTYDNGQPLHPGTNAKEATISP